MQKNAFYDGLHVQVYIENVRAAPQHQATYRAYEPIIAEALKTVLPLREFPHQQLQIVLAVLNDASHLVELATFINAASLALRCFGLLTDRLLLAADVGKPPHTVASVGPSFDQLVIFRAADGTSSAATPKEIKKMSAAGLVKVRDLYKHHVRKCLRHEDARVMRLREILL